MMTKDTRLTPCSFVLILHFRASIRRFLSVTLTSRCCTIVQPVKEKTTCSQRSFSCWLLFSRLCPTSHNIATTNENKLLNNQTISVQALMTDWGKKQPHILRTFSYRNLDVFTIQSPSFNVQIRSQKKLLGIMRFSEGLKIEIWGAFFWYLTRFVVI